MNVKPKIIITNSVFQSVPFKRIRSILFGTLGVMLVTLLFFSVLGYGAYLNRIGDSSSYKHALLRAADLDFSFVENYSKGKFAAVDKMEIDLKFKHQLRLQYLREKAMENDGKYISEEAKQETFPADLNYNGKTYKVKISLTGKMVYPHLQKNAHWSFQVKVKDGETVDGMKRFGMLVPRSRGHLTDWLAIQLMEERGLIALRSDFKDVSINGKEIGIYYMEERFDKYLLENNKLKEGIIFKMEDDLEIYQEASLMQAADTRSQVLLLRQLWQKVATGSLPANQLFDLEKMAKLYAIADLMNSHHPLLRDNMRFYFNPLTGLVEPIGREFENLKDNDLGDMTLFLDAPKEGTWHYWVKQDKVLQKIFDNPDFEKYYIREIEALTQEELLDHFFSKHEDKLHQLMSGIYKDWSFYELPKYTLYENQDYLRSKLHSGMPALTAHFSEKNDKVLCLEIANQQFLPLEVSALSWRDSIHFLPKETFVLDSKKEGEKANFSYYYFKIPDEVVWTDSLLPELKIQYNYLGLEKGKKSALVFPISQDLITNQFTNPAIRTPNHLSFGFIYERGNTIVIPKGKWTLSKDLIIPKDRKFEIEAGAEIDLINQAKIICYSPIYTKGNENSLVIIHSSDATGEGLFVLGTKERSKLSHTLFDRISRPDENGWRLSGALTFYESPVSISNCTFSNNKIGDDFLNIVRSDFSMEKVEFRNILADAFDCDYCTGTIADAVFSQIGNDAIDVSGTTIEIHNIRMDGIGDKGLSAGENSTFIASNVEIKNAEIAITSKDQSTLKITDAQLIDCRIGLALFQKKSEFGPGTINAERVEIGKSEHKYLVEENSQLVFDGLRVESNQFNVKQILYGAEYGKSSH